MIGGGMRMGLPGRLASRANERFLGAARAFMGSRSWCSQCDQRCAGFVLSGKFIFSFTAV